jgi:hypothetical protein
VAAEAMPGHRSGNTSTSGDLDGGGYGINDLNVLLRHRPRGILLAHGSHMKSSAFHAKRLSRINPSKGPETPAWGAIRARS